MTRTYNVKRNLTFNIIKFIAQIILQFVLRTILIYIMGVEYIGLNGLFGNIFSFLNLAELGIGSAIVFAMYKPIAENDIEKIKSLQNLYKKFYLIIAIIVLVVGGIFTPFISFFISEPVKANINIYILFLMYLFNAFVGYFSAHKRSLLLAYQRNDIENKISTICIFLMIISQICTLLIFRNYYIFYSLNILSTIVECVVIHIVASKLYPEIKGKSVPLDKKTKKSITKNVTALSMHKIGSAIVFSTDNILISSFFGLVVLGAYSNYSMVLNSLTSIFLLLTTSLTGSVGNLIASQSVDYTYSKFKQINFIYSILTSFCTICLFILFQPFITIWTGGGEYLLNFSTVILICISFYLTKMRSGVGLFKDCAGLFWKDRWRPVIEAVINLGVSICLAYIMGINGIFIGTIISTLVAPFWCEPYVLYKKYFKKGLGNYFKRYFLDVVIMLVVCIICYYTCALIPDDGVWLLIAKFAVCIVLCLGLLILAYCWTPEFKETYNSLVKPLVNKIFKRRKIMSISEEKLLEKNELSLNVNKDEQDSIGEKLSNSTKNDALKHTQNLKK